jgi:hypothetical protein
MWPFVKRQIWKTLALNKSQALAAFDGRCERHASRRRASVLAERLRPGHLLTFEPAGRTAGQDWVLSVAFSS